MNDDNGNDIVIQQTSGGSDLARVRELRYEILRKPLGLPFASSSITGDEDESTIHLQAVSASQLIGCASLLMDESSSIQLRGMAVAADWQGRGVGQRIVETAVDIATARAKTLWCNARISAIGFYERHGWKQSGPIIDVPMLGQHVVMKWSRNLKNDV